MDISFCDVVSSKREDLNGVGRILAHMENPMSISVDDVPFIPKEQVLNHVSKRQKSEKTEEGNHGSKKAEESDHGSEKTEERNHRSEKTEERNHRSKKAEESDHGSEKTEERNNGSEKA